MCFDLDSSPPIPILRGAAVSHDDVTLTGADGNTFAVFHATPDEPNGVGVVILPDVRGLYRFYEELALRFAERGYTAAAFDYFGRTAGATKRGDDFPYMDHVKQTTTEDVQSDVAAVVAHLRPSTRAMFTVGFCFGGRQSWLAAASGHGLAGAIGFYGRPGRSADGVDGPIHRADAIAAPILALMGGADEAIPEHDVRELERALGEAGVENEVVIYPGAPHSFFDRKFDEHAEASADAWQRVLAFLERHS